MMHAHPPRLFHDFFARAVLDHSGSCAIEIPPGEERPDSVRVTFAELDAEADRVRGIVAPSVAGECVVAIFLLPESPLVYAAQLAVLRAGAAFVCLDVGFPKDHVSFVLKDSGAVAVLTDASGREALAGGVLDAAKILDVNAPSQQPQTFPAQDPETPDWLTETSLAYVIYTSGTTGRPKGVMVEHHSAVHLIAQELDYLELTPSDRCIQVSSPAYDSSIEESWLPLAAGATVIVADSDIVRLGPDLVPWLQEVRATVLMPTPTLLRMTSCANPQAELPALRIVYVGGEPVSQDLVDRWAPGRRFENGYGPTECTVTITRGRLLPGRSVTIGKVIAGNTAWILDEQLEPVSLGAEGELCISGPQVARGYLDRPELTAERFPTLPGIGRIYRTGDLVRSGDGGDLLYLGRADTQVKVRGYRIELESIEASIAALPGVAAAACRVARKPGGQDLIEAFFVPDERGAPGEEPAPPSIKAIVESLRATLPTYMVPSRIQAIDGLPTTTSGKLDRRALPESTGLADPTQPLRRAGSLDSDGRSDPSTEQSIGPSTGAWSELERVIAAALASPLGLGTIGLDDDYFDVGGDSLGVATAISILREADGTAAGPESLSRSLGARDIYEHRTVRALARHLENSPAHSTGKARTARTEIREGAFPLAVTAGQVAWLSMELAAGTWAAYAVVFLALPAMLDALGVPALLLLGPVLAPLAAGIYAPLALSFAVLVKRVLIGKYTARRAPVWSGFYLRHWIVQRAVGLFPWGLLQGTVFYGAVLRALGARIGKRVHIHRGVDLLAGGWDLLTIGDDVTLCQDTALDLVHLEDGEIVIGPVTLENGCTLEVRAGVGEHTTVGENAELSALSYLPAGKSIEAGARYDGVPAQVQGQAAAAMDTQIGAAAGQPLSPQAHGLLLIASRGALGLMATWPPAALAAAITWSVGVDADGAARWLGAPAGSWMASGLVMALAGLSLVPWLAVSAMILRLTPSIPVQSMSRWSLGYVWLWIRTGLLERAGSWLAGSLFWRWWLRLAGMRMGRNCEVSTILDVLPEHVSIGDESFFADGIYLCGPRIRRGVVETGMAEFGERVFLGNHVVIPPGTRLPSDVLLGVSTAVRPEDVRPGSSWFGHPPFELPRREVVEGERELTHDPSLGRYLHRVLWELMRLTIPAVLALGALVWLQLAAGLGFWLAPLASMAVIAGLAALVCATKWILLGRVQPGTHGFWSAWCCRWDFVYVAWGMIARGALSRLGGTLLLPWYLRAMGVRVGKRVVLGGEFAQVVDPDMLEFADHTTIDRPLFQAHSFEDRMLKIDRVHVGIGATVRRATVLFYGSHLQPGSHVAPHSVVMKNEVLSEGVSYRGVPTRPTR